MLSKKVMKICAALVLAGVVIMGALLICGADINDIINNLSFSGSLFANTSGYRNFDNEYRASGEYSVPAGGVSSVRLDWIAGDISIVKGDGEQIGMTERSQDAIDAKTALKYGVENGTLYVQYCDKGIKSYLPAKSLTLSLPAELFDNMETLGIDVASADVSASGISANTFDFDSASGSLAAAEINASTVKLSSASGTIDFSGVFGRITADTSSGDIRVASLAGAPAAQFNTASGKLALEGAYSSVEAESASGNISLLNALVTGETEIESASGKLELQGGFGMLELETSSGTIEVRANKCPASIKADTASGGVRLYLPADSNFTLDYNTASGDTDIGFAVSIKDGKYIVGDGSAPIKVRTASGSLTINKS